MSQDIPAAHSMDSMWFAVDEDGKVGVFETGEGGALPRGDFPYGMEAGADDPLEESDLFAALLLLRAAREPSLRELLPEDPEQTARLLEEAYWEFADEGAQLLGAVGAFRFVCDDYAGGPYIRENDVGVEVTVDELPEPLRSRLRKARLPVRFEALRMLAPGEYVRVDSWSQTWVDTRGQLHPCDPKGRIPKDIEAGDFREFLDELPEEPEEPFDLEALLEQVREMLEHARAHERPAPSSSPAPGDDDEDELPRKSGLLAWLTSLFSGS